MRPNSPAQASEHASPFSALLDTGEAEPNDRPDPPTPREPADAPRRTGFVRNKPAAKNASKPAGKASDGREPARNAAADGKPSAQDAKETGDSEKAKTETPSEDAGAKADLAVADATNAIADSQPVTPQPVAAVLPLTIAPTAPDTSEAKPEDIVLAPAAAPALSPADAALAAEAAAETEAAAAAEAEKPAAKPVADQPKSEAKPEKAQTAAQNAAPKQTLEAKALEGQGRPDSEKGENRPAETKDAKPAPEHNNNSNNNSNNNDVRPEAPRLETATPARGGSENNPTLAQANHQAPATMLAPAPVPVAAGSPVPVAGLAVEIATQSRAGKNRFEIRLDPPELGRIDVRLDVDRDGNVTSRLIVERSETLDLLRRDAPQLERALEQAGLKTSDNGLQFSLRDQSPQNPQNPQADNPRAARLVIPDAELPETAQRQYGRLSGLGAGLDIRV